jgi:AcrR family transcriptional regulator
MSSCPEIRIASWREYPPIMPKVPTPNARNTLRDKAPTRKGTGQPHTGERPTGRLSQRADILEAAVDLFAKGGSRGTPMAAIAERIGVSIPAITHHFGSKHGLFIEVVAVSDSLDETRTTRSDAESGIERLSAIRFWARELTSDSALANLSRLTLVMTAEALDADFPAHEHFVARHRRFRHMIAETVADGQRDGSVAKRCDPDRLAVEIIAFVQGSVLQWHLDPEAIDLVAVFDSYFDRLVEDVAGAAPTVVTRTARAKPRAAKKQPAESANGAKRGPVRH